MYDGKANAAYIVRACNALPDLLEACKAFVAAYDRSHQLEKTDVAVRMARAAIAKAQP